MEIKKYYKPPTSESTSAFDIENSGDGLSPPIKVAKVINVSEVEPSVYLSAFTCMSWVIRAVSIVLILNGAYKFMTCLTAAMDVGSQNLIIKGPNIDTFIEIAKQPFLIGGVVKSFHGLLDVLVGLVSLNATFRPSNKSTNSYFKYMIVFVVAYFLCIVLEFLMYAKTDGVTLGQWIEGSKKEAGHYTVKRECSENTYSFDYSGRDYELIDYEEKDYFIEFLVNLIWDDFNFTPTIMWFVFMLVGGLSTAFTYSWTAKKATQMTSN
jgi:hypothetical protein